MKRPIQVFLSALFVSILFFACSRSGDPNAPDLPTLNDITITSISPTHGPGNIIDTIIGKNFDRIPVVDSIVLNGRKLTVLSRTAEKIIIQIPSLAGSGNIDIWYQGQLLRGPVFNYDSLLMVTTLAGNAFEAASVDGQGLNARFNNPQGIAVDASGNIYVADSNAIRKITPEGNVNTLAGALTGFGTYQDGTGAGARFSNTWGLAIGPDNYLYVGDHYNYRIRKVSLTSVVTTLAGQTWNTGPLGGQIDGPLSVATFNSPTGIALDNQNNVYTADLYNNKIRKVTATGTVSSYAGGDYYHYGFLDGPAATALFHEPHSVATDPSGNVYVSEWNPGRIRKISTTGNVSTLYGPIEPTITGPTTGFQASALATDRDGNLFFAVTHGIYKRTPDGTTVRYAAGGMGEIDGPAQIATYRKINGIAIDPRNGTMYITDRYRIRKLAWQ